MNNAQKKNNGVLYNAFGYWYILMSCYSVVSLKKYNDIRVKLITDFPIKNITFNGVELFEEIEVSEIEKSDNRLSKLSMFKDSPFKKTLFIDCDTEIRGDISSLFRLLDYGSILLKMNNYPARRKSIFISENKDQSIQDLGFTEFNSGVIGFDDSNEAKEFFNEWNKNFISMGVGPDQPSLARPIYNNPGLPLLPLSSMWNLKPDNPIDKTYLATYSESVKILHYREMFKYKAIYIEFIKMMRDLEIKMNRELFDEELKEINETESAIKRRDGNVKKYFSRHGDKSISGVKKTKRNIYKKILSKIKSKLKSHIK